MIIDVDSHISEPGDLWTSRVSNRWGDLVPHVKWAEDRSSRVPRRWVEIVGQSF